MIDAFLGAINGPVVAADGVKDARMYEIALVGNERLLGEVIRIEKERAYIQIYEEPVGLSVGEPVSLTGNPLQIELGPGLLGAVLDGIGRPLSRMNKNEPFIRRGEALPTLNPDALWLFSPAISKGMTVAAGDIIGHVNEGKFVHKIFAPFNLKSGRAEYIAKDGNYNCKEIVVRLENGETIALSQRWGIRKPRPVKEKKHFQEPLLTGMRVLDSFFPVAMGGSAIIPGGFGTGKTVTQQSLAKYCNAQVIVYVGCGERGNEMTEVLEEFPLLNDALTGGNLMDRTVLIANTSNMPVAARESSIYIGITIAEYFRDMGYNVALMADSTSRWAEALREISGRLEEMPGEEGYPTYLSSRLAQFYERSGISTCIGSPERTGAITVVSAVSPAGGDFSEPVTQASLRMGGAFWGLDKKLAQQRHFPSVNWGVSYTLYEFELERWFSTKLGEDWKVLRIWALRILEREASLKEMVQLVGRDSLSDHDKLNLDIAQWIRTIFLQQNAFDDIDAYCPIEKQRYLLEAIRSTSNEALQALSKGVSYDSLSEIAIRKGLEDIKVMPYTSNFKSRSKDIVDSVNSEINSLEAL